MRRFLFITLLTTQSLSLAAQPAGLLLHSSRPPQLAHRVVAKESLLSISRSYHVHPEQLRLLNGLQAGNSLRAGQRILIPLSDTNFSKKKSKGRPVYYAVKKGATFSKVIKEVGFITAAQLRSLNGLTASSLGGKKRLIVGYLRQTPRWVASAKEDTVSNTLQVLRTDSSKQDVMGRVATEPLAASTIRDQALYRFLVSGQGYFKNAFEEYLDESDPLQQLVKAAVFKTQSGFLDQKYYVITNLAPVGTYVYLYADAQSRGVYAKVIGPLHDIRLNQGLDLRVSNAAVLALGIGEGENFSLTLYYWPSSNR